jgi:apolipoprotein N-acyltransferase
MKTFFSRARLAAAAAAAWAAGLSSAWAQPGAGPEKTSYDYTFAYALVLLGVVLGLLCVLRPSGRRHEVRPEQYVSKNVLVEEK